MASQFDTSSHPLIRKLEVIAPVSGAERQAIAALPMTVRDMKPGQDIVSDQDRPSQCCLLLEGFLLRYKIMPSGRRQIYSFHLPGDIPDLQSLHLDVMDHTLGTAAPSRVGLITHNNMRAFIRAHPRIGELFWRDTLIDAAIFREWIGNIGRRQANERVAHMFCEVYVRLRALHRADEGRFVLPLTQVDLADATGISAVHMNRTMQFLRGAGLISTERGQIKIADWEGLQELAEFDPTYLHLRQPPEPEPEHNGRAQPASPTARV